MIRSTSSKNSRYFGLSCAESSLTSFRESLRWVGAGVDAATGAFAAVAVSGFAVEPGPSTPIVFAFGLGRLANLPVISFMSSVATFGGASSRAVSINPPDSLPCRATFSCHTL